jgi:hypothetical protein
VVDPKAIAVIGDGLEEADQIIAIRLIIRSMMGFG